MLEASLKGKSFPIVFLTSLLIALGLAVACWDINFWPTDAEVYYMPAAKELPALQHLSQINDSLDEERIKWLHGKEMHVLAISLLQRLMGDTHSLRPLLVLGIVCIFFSSLLIFAVARRLWGNPAAVAVWFFFASSFWPYLYVLFTKHQTQGLMFFLLSVWLVLAARSWVFYVLAGLAMGISIFSSTVSFLYLPYILAAFIYVRRHFVRNGVVFSAGFLALLMYVNFPDIIANLKSYWDYIHISGQYNHFFYNQKVLAQWLPDFDLKDTRGGWVWVFKYFCLVMPVVFPLYIASVIFLLVTRKGALTLALVALSFAPAVLAEFKGVAQYGANYFPAFLGMLMLMGHAIHSFVRYSGWVPTPALYGVVMAVQIACNAAIFTGDIYPSRMATTLISRMIDRGGIKDIYTFENHPLRRNIADNLNESTLRSHNIRPIASVIQAPAGYILLPPVSTDTIYRGSNGDYNDFDEDLVLNQIIRQGKLKDYAVASFKTLGSSLIWSQEEEILAYRYLVLNQFQGGDMSRAWVLDAPKIQNDRSQLLPTAEDLFLYRNRVRNIGTRSKQIMYTGYQGGLAKPAFLKGLAVRMFKMGNPEDQLRAFIFKLDDKQPMWVPYARNFISQSVDASQISASPEGGPVVFPFDPPLQLGPGAFFAVIYRTGHSSDTEYYRIYSDVLGRVE